MKSSHLKILGILAIAMGLITGPLGVLVSLTGIGTPPLWLQTVLLLVATLTIIALKQVLHSGFAHYGSDKFLVYFLVFTVFRFIVKAYRLDFIAHWSMQFVGSLVLFFTPIMGLLFYISLLRIKNFWVRFYGVLGLLVSVIGVFEQITYLLLLLVLDPSKHLALVVASQLASEALISYIKIFQYCLLGGLLIWGGFLKTNARNKKPHVPEY